MLHIHVRTTHTCLSDFFGNYEHVNISIIISVCPSAAGISGKWNDNSDNRTVLWKLKCIYV